MNVNIEELSELRTFQSMTIDKVSNNREVRLRKSANTEYFRRYGSRHRGKEMYGNKSHYEIARDILKACIGKNVNHAFSIFCKIVRQEHQQEFWDALDLDPYADIYNSWKTKYLITDDFILIKNPEYIQGRYRGNNYKVKPRFESFDYKSGRYHKVTGQPYPDYYSYRRLAGINDDDYEVVVTKGFDKEFDTKTDPELKRLNWEKRKTIAKMHRDKIRLEKSVAYNFLTKSEKKIILDRVEDVIRMQALGFDENSFRGLEYHGCKRKRKKLKNKLRS